MELFVVFFYIIIIFVVFGIVRKSKEAKDRPAAQSNRPKPNAPQFQRPSPITTPKNNTSSNRQHVSLKKSNVCSLMDDRENDWLANQLRDEHRAFKMTKDMFDLKIEHSSHCDARYLRTEHQRHCSADAVDKAEN